MIIHQLRCILSEYISFGQRMIPKRPAPAEAGVADLSDKITRKVKGIGMLSDSI
jgi:hypothetical protein